MLTSGDMGKGVGRCENVKLPMGEYHLKYHIFTIKMDGHDIVLGTKLLFTLGPITMNFKGLYKNFTKHGYKRTLNMI